MAVNNGGAEMRELGAGLRNLRDQRGLTVRALADASGQSSANISHWETGGRLPTEERLSAVLDALNTQHDERDRLLGLRRQAEGPGQLVAGAPSIGAQLKRLIEYEQVARRIVDVAPLVVPGLLQTADYARATLRGLSDIDTRVTLRVGRRDIITRPREPAELLALIDSAVLVRPIAAPQVMVEQLRHLLAMAERPNVEIRLVSSTTPGYTSMLAGPFILLEFPSAAPVVHLEHRRASAFLWERDDIEGFSAAVEEISSVAMTPARSAEVIAEIVNGLETR
jgi:transcriptional regulator with XRE-family HTH domain